MSETYELKREIVIEARPETIFSYLTEESKMKEWYGEIVEAEARPGGVFHVGTNDGLHCRGQYVEVVPHEKVVFTWGGMHDLEPGATTVEIKLKAEGQGTRLMLRHYNITQKSAADGFGQGWKEHALPLLKAASEGKKPAGFCFQSDSECSKKELKAQGSESESS